MFSDPLWSRRNPPKIDWDVKWTSRDESFFQAEAALKEALHQAMLANMENITRAMFGLGPIPVQVKVGDQVVLISCVNCGGARVVEHDHPLPCVRCGCDSPL